ncbi:MAG TPA: outer membrane beta-barrel protein [Steroidobacteraceae bacterium]|jgi:opacity protein-like surface antigen
MRSLRPHFGAACLSILGLLAVPPAAVADGLLGLYAGAAVGESQVKADASALGDFKENHSAFKLFAGLRPISLVGAEISYMDFGHPHGTINGIPSNVSERGAAAFGVLYLPVPVIDVFLKAGLARVQSTVNAVFPGVGTCTVSVPNCALFKLDRTNTSFAAGAGVQAKFGPLAVRVEYERVNAAGATPGLASIGLSWSF